MCTSRVIQENKVLRGESNAFVIEHGGHRVDLMSFALSHQSESNRALNNKTSTPACNRFLYQDLTNNWNSKSHDNLLLSPLTGVNQTASRPLQLSALGFDFARVPIRPKLRVSQPGDVYEQEADSVAERVMTISEPVVQLRWSYRRDTSKYLTAQPKEKEHIQDKRVQATDWRLSSVSPIVKEVISSPGQPLDSIAREFMESRFGYDFGQIRIHADSSAAKSAEVLGADAYTFGTHIAFAQTHFPPSTQHGMILLAHELVHTIQQAQLPRLRPNKSRSTINPNIHEAWNLDKSIHIGTATPHIALGPKKKRVGQAAQGPKFVGMRLGLNDDMQEVKVKREVGSTQGYDDRLQAIAVARLSRVEPAVVAQGIDGKWHAFETTVESYGGVFYLSPDVPNMIKLVDTVKPFSSINSTHNLEDFIKARKAVKEIEKAMNEPGANQKVLRERMEGAAVLLKSVKGPLASSIFGVPQTEIQFNQFVSQRQPGKINISAESRPLAEGAHGWVGDQSSGFEEGKSSAFDINLDLLEEPERAVSTLFHEVSHLKDFELAQMWVKKYKESGGIFVKTDQRLFRKWMMEQVGRKQLSKADAWLVLDITSDLDATTEARANIRTFLATLQAGAPDLATDRLVTYASALPPGAGYAAPAPGHPVYESLTKELQMAYKQMSKVMQQQFDDAIAAAKRKNPNAWVSKLKFSK